jgi:hypothetical protein
MAKWWWLVREAEGVAVTVGARVRDQRGVSQRYGARMLAPTPWRVAAPGRQQLDANPDVVWHAAGEQVGLLHRRQVAGVGQPRLEGLKYIRRQSCRKESVRDPPGG